MSKEQIILAQASTPFCVAAHSLILRERKGLTGIWVKNFNDIFLKDLLLIDQLFYA